MSPGSNLAQWSSIELEWTNGGQCTTQAPAQHVLRCCLILKSHGCVRSFILKIVTLCVVDTDMNHLLLRAKIDLTLLFIYFFFNI